MMSAALKTIFLCLLVLSATSCQFLRGPCGLWPHPELTGGEPVTQKFSSAEGRFRFGLPARDETPATNANTNSKTFKWLLLNVGQVQIVYSDSDDAVATPEVSQSIFNNLRNRASSQGKLIGDTEISLSGHTGREFRVKAEQGTQIDRIYLARNRIYVLTAFVPQSLNCKIDSAVKILDTFEIVDTQ